MQDQRTYEVSLKTLLFAELQEIFLLLQTIRVSTIEKIIYINASVVSEEKEINQLDPVNTANNFHKMIREACSKLGEGGADVELPVMIDIINHFMKKNNIKIEKIHGIIQSLENGDLPNSGIYKHLRTYGFAMFCSAIIQINNETLNQNNMQAYVKTKIRANKILSQKIIQPETSEKVRLSEKKITSSLINIKKNDYEMKKMYAAITAISDALKINNIEEAMTALATLGDYIFVFSTAGQKIIGPLLSEVVIDEASLKFIMAMDALKTHGIYSSPKLHNGIEVYINLIGLKKYNAAFESTKDQVPIYIKKVCDTIVSQSKAPKIESINNNEPIKNEYVKVISALKDEAYQFENIHDTVRIINFSDELERKIVYYNNFDDDDDDEKKHKNIMEFFDQESKKISRLISFNIKDKIKIIILKIRKKLDSLFTTNLLEDPDTSITSRYAFYKKQKEISDKFSQVKEAISDKKNILASKDNTSRKGNLN